MRRLAVVLSVFLLLVIPIGCVSADSSRTEPSKLPQTAQSSTAGGISGIIGITPQAITTNPSIVASNGAIKTTPSAISGFNFFISINLDTNKLTLFKNGVKVTSFDVATGRIVNGVSLTPTGKFKIVKMVRNPSWGGGGYAKPIKGGDPHNPLGKVWMGLDVGKVPGGTYGVHGTNDESSIGKWVSHGCVRMHNSDAESVYTTVSKETNVWIGSTKQLSEWKVVDFD